MKATVDIVKLSISIGGGEGGGNLAPILYYEIEIVLLHFLWSFIFNHKKIVIISITTIILITANSISTVIIIKVSTRNEK